MPSSVPFKIYMHAVRLKAMGPKHILSKDSTLKETVYAKQSGNLSSFYHVKRKDV